MFSVYLLWLLGGICFFSQMTRAKPCFAAFATDDDMKIAPDSMDKILFPQDRSEDAAQEFVSQRDNGNIERARELGKVLASHLLSIEKSLDGAPDEMSRQQMVLYAFTVSRMLEEQPINIWVMETAQSEFFDCIQAHSQELYECISDSAAFSLYIYNDRKQGDGQTGETFAILCGREADKQLAELGDNLYRSYRKLCRDSIAAAKFVKD